MMLVYNVDSGLILAKIPIGQPYNYFKGNNSHLILDKIPSDWRDCKVVNGELVKLSQVEITELKNYGEILSKEKRHEINLLRKLTPTQKEIEDAEKTIDMANFIQEVM